MAKSNLSLLVTHVFPRLGDLHRTRAALAVMASVTLDDDRVDDDGVLHLERRVYFGGWRPIAQALALQGSPAIQQQAVSRALRPARELGFIRVAQRARRGRNVTTYQLLLEPHEWARPLACHTQGSLASHTQVGLASHTQVGLASHTQAEEEGRTEGGTREEPRSPLLSTTGRARAKRPAPRSVPAPWQEATHA